MRLFGRAFAFVDSENFLASTKIYLRFCEKHNIYSFDYERGYNSVLNCQLCSVEFMKKANEDRMAKLK